MPPTLEIYKKIVTDKLEEGFSNLAKTHSQSNPDISKLIKDLLKNLKSKIKNTDDKLKIPRIIKNSTASMLKNVNQLMKKKLEPDLNQVPTVRQLFKEEYDTIFKKSMKELRSNCNNLKKVILNFDKELKFLSSKLKIAEEKGVKPASISDNDVRTYLTKIADRAMNELLLEEERKNSVKQNKHLKRKYRKKTHNQRIRNLKTVTNELDTLNEKKNLKLTKAQLLTKYNIRLNKRKSLFSELNRVTNRWKTRDYDALRRLVDKDLDGQEIYRYASLSDRDLDIQRARHYLPGIEVIISNKNDRRIYSFPTDRGVGLMAKLHIGKNIISGIIYMGIGNDSVIYHKYFEDLNAVHTHIFTDKQPALAEDDHKEEWNSKRDYILEVSKNGVITIDYPQNNHKLQIFPLRKELLNNKIFTT